MAPACPIGTSRRFNADGLRADRYNDPEEGRRMPMEGSSEEYEKLTLASLKKAASPDSDATYHNTRASIFASLASAAASAEMAEALKRLAGPSTPESPARSAAPAPRGEDNGNGTGNGKGDGRPAPGKDLVRRESA
ncbi:MAG: hypothetical protein KDB35_05160 [Acidimicrobiales bacterium]|nr:hypothetical protein [Acidimicrobiales bacterium]